MTVEPSERDRETAAAARRELGAAMQIVDCLESLDGDSRARVLAATVILTGVASIEVVRTVLRRVQAAYGGGR